MTLPDPLAADGVVTTDPAEPVLTVKPAEASGYAALLWRRGWRALAESEANGIRGRTPSAWAHAPGRRQIVRGQPGEGQTLQFRFPRGNPTYKELVSQPGLSATVVVDRETGHILSVRFHHGRRT